MAEETDLSRTEPASAKRLQEARRAGDVPRSAELTGWLVLLAALGAFTWLAPHLLDALSGLMRAALTQAARPTSVVFADSALADALLAALWTFFPLLAIAFVVALVAPVALSGWVYAPQASQADWSRANPFKFFVRAWSVDALFDGARTLLKWLLAGAVLAWLLADGGGGWQALGAGDVRAALPRAAGWVGHGLAALVGALALIAALDAGWRWWRYLRRHAMTWQEVLAEARESEVSPEVRARIRGRQQQAGRRSPANPLTEKTGADARRASIDEVIG
ncbi:MAG: EscU/YscU/HrcU family type III secretion system export apparatus switch protein [Thiobacillus sp.]|nr:EscU/YscU/HrcU family type III secretion system export apparatus switch protein [Thiobacillus sp.]